MLWLLETFDTETHSEELFVMISAKPQEAGTVEEYSDCLFLI
jgi:hypothetical protein